MAQSDYFQPHLCFTARDVFLPASHLVTAWLQNELIQLLNLERKKKKKRSERTIFPLDLEMKPDVFVVGRTARSDAKEEGCV